MSIAGSRDRGIVAETLHEFTAAIRYIITSYMTIPIDLTIHVDTSVLASLLDINRAG